MNQKKSSKTHALYQHARQRIPGGTQLLSKRPEMFAPEQWPAYFREARGCEVWDLEGNHYFDMSHNGVGACLLGYAHPEVTEAVTQRITKGSCCTLNPAEEVALADELCTIHPWAERVRFGRGGGEACAIAIRIARATTGRSVVAVCGYHGWEDWYLAANLGKNDALDGHLLPGLAPDGVPRALRGTTLTFPYEDRAALQRIIDEHGEDLAAIIMEPCRYRDPEQHFLADVRDSAHAAGALLILDEITIGWRTCLGGAHLRLGVDPDIAVFAKALGNGHPISAVIGTAPAMEGAEHSFISSTTWTESVGPVAALATLRLMRKTEVWRHVAAMGKRVQTIWREQAARHNLPITVPDTYPCLAHFIIDHPEANAVKTLFTQEMLKRGYLAASAFYPTLAHTQKIIDRYGERVDETFRALAETLRNNTLKKDLKGPLAHQGFQRLL